MAMIQWSYVFTSKYFYYILFTLLLVFAWLTSHTTETITTASDCVIKWMTTLIFYLKLNYWVYIFLSLPDFIFFFKVWYENPPMSTLLYALSNASSCCSQNTLQFQRPLWDSGFPFRQIGCALNGKMLSHLSSEVEVTMTSIHN
jgi:hypothetical protein